MSVLSNRLAEARAYSLLDERPSRRRANRPRRGDWWPWDWIPGVWRRVMACLHAGEPSCRYHNRFLSRTKLFGEGGHLTPRRAASPDTAEM